MWIGVPLLLGAAVLAAWIWIDTRHEPAPAEPDPPPPPASLDDEHTCVGCGVALADGWTFQLCVRCLPRSRPDRCIECGATLPVSHPWPRCTACFSARIVARVQARAALPHGETVAPLDVADEAAIARLLAGVDRVWQKL